MSDRKTPHLQDDELLTLLDGELPDREASEFRSHMEACWTCRTRLEEIETTIGEYVRYRDAIRPLFPAPTPWGDLQPVLERIDRSLATARPVRPIRMFVLRPAFWMAAAALVLVFVVVRRFEYVPQVSAAELLRKASAGEQKPAPQRRIQITTRRRQFIRPAALAMSDASSELDLQGMFEKAHFNWDEPLSARSFAAWREQLPEKSDTVPALDNFVYKIQTSTSASELRQATLTLRAHDLQPLSETLEFTTDMVEITAAPDAENAAEKTAETPAVAPERAASRETSRPTEVLSPFHRELQVFSALHKIDADLGEPVEMNQNGSRLLVTGTGLTAAQKQQLRASLEEIPGVEIRFDDATLNARASRAPADRATSATAPAQQRLQTLLGSRESVEDFTDRVLDTSDAMMARAHALRSLAKAFPTDVEASLTAGDRGLLTSLRHDHAAALGARVHELQTVLEPVLIRNQTPPRGGDLVLSWQDAAEGLFAAAQNLDQLLNRALAGSNADARDSDLQRITSALVRVEQAASAIP